MFNFDQVHQITHNADYAYGFNGESLVFATRSPYNSEPGFDPFLSINRFTFRCIFLCILKNHIIFPLLFGNTQSSSEAKNDESDPVDSIFSTALAITDDSSNVIIGQSDGSLAILNLKQFLDSHLKSDENVNIANKFELTGNNYTNYKFIHKNEITKVAFLKGNRRAIIGDKAGVITLLSFVKSVTCELVVQTTIVNLKMPYFSLEVYPEDNVFAMASARGFSVIRAGRRIEVLLCSEDENINPEICFSFEKFTENVEMKNRNETKEVSKNRILICQNRSVFVFDVDCIDNKKIDQWNFDLPAANEDSNSNKLDFIFRCFIIKHLFFLLLFKNGEAVIIKYKTGEIVSKISDLPTNANSSRIQLYENELIYFLKSDIVQKKIDFPFEINK